MRMTTKQIQILQIVVDGNVAPDGTRTSSVDIDQLLDRLPYTASKQALQCSVRYLREKALLGAPEFEIRRGRRRVILVPTQTAIDIIRVPQPSVPVGIESEDVDDYGIVEYT